MVLRGHEQSSGEFVGFLLDAALDALVFVQPIEQVALAGNFLTFEQLAMQMEMAQLVGE